MTNMSLREFADRTTGPRQYLTSADPGWWTYASAFTSIAILIAIIVCAVVVLLDLRHRERPPKGIVATPAVSLARRRELDNEAEWLRRTQWALGAASSSNDRMFAFGAVILEALARSDLAGPEDKALLDTVWARSCTRMRDDEIRHLVAEFRAVIEQDRDEPTPQDRLQLSADRQDKRQDPPASGENDATRRRVAGNTTSANPTIKERVYATLRREILIARLKVTLDQQLGRETSPTVICLSQMKLPPIVQ